MPARAVTPETFTVYWNAERVAFATALEPGARLEVLFGGPHQSQPSFLRADVRPGDFVVPINLRRGVLLALGCMRVQRILSVEEDDAEADAWRHRYAAWAFLAQTCTTEVLIGARGTRLRLDRRVPRALLTDWRFESRRGSRELRRRDDDRLATHAGLDAIYRVDATTGEGLQALTGALRGVR